jgi:hypothetical protein
MFFTFVYMFHIGHTCFLMHVYVNLLIVMEWVTQLGGRNAFFFYQCMDFPPFSLLSFFCCLFLYASSGWHVYVVTFLCTLTEPVMQDTYNTVCFSA